MMTDELVSWLIEFHTDLDLAMSIGIYVKSRGNGCMVDILSGDTQLQDFAHAHDILGWDNFWKAA
jgi:hypothetical protein